MMVRNRFMGSERAVALAGSETPEGFYGWERYRISGRYIANPMLLMNNFVETTLNKTGQKLVFN